MPGNLNGEKEYKGAIGTTTPMIDADMRKFRLLCLPNTKLSELMINDIRVNHKISPHYLHMVGIRMHVLADTWAHQFFAGTLGKRS